MHEMEERWVLAAKQGTDSRFFGYLVKEHQLAVRGYLRRLTRGNATLSDDLAQEAFLTAYKKINSFKSTGSFKSWLLAISYRVFLMHMRKNSSNPLMNFPTENYDGEEIEELAQISTNADDIADKIDMENAFHSLKKNQRSTLTLCYSYGMSHSEISEIMDMPLGTVKSHIARGKDALRKILMPTKEDVLC